MKTRREFMRHVLGTIAGAAAFGAGIVIGKQPEAPKYVAGIDLAQGDSFTALETLDVTTFVNDGWSDSNYDPIGDMQAVRDRSIGISGPRIDDAMAAWREYLASKGFDPDRYHPII